MKVSIADLQGLRDMHTKRIEGLKKQTGSPFMFYILCTMYTPDKTFKLQT